MINLDQDPEPPGSIDVVQLLILMAILGVMVWLVLMGWA